MKKICSVLLILAMIFSVSACGSTPEASSIPPLVLTGMTPEDALTAIVDRTASFGKLNLELNSTVSTSSDPTSTTDLATHTVLRIEGLGSEDFRAAQESAQTISGSRIDLKTNTYYADGIFMVDSSGTDLMGELSTEDAAGHFDAGIALRPTAYLTGLTMTQDETAGTYTLTGSIDMTQATDLAKEYSRYMGLNHISNLIWDPTTYTLVVNSQGDPVSASLTTGAMFTASEAIGVCTAQFDYSYLDTGDGFAVEIPNASGFTKVAPEALGLD